ncbi:putative lipid II flippase FtsW [Patescibacteria group bacterium]|nr:putative lipid II flippase FtsW [Patescibacteria group bacterium]
MKNKNYDKFFFWIVCLTVLAGFFILFSASMGLLSRDGADFSSIIFKQIFFGLLGFVIFLITSKINYKKWQKFALPFFIFSFLLTLLVFEPHIGFGHSGAKRWINLGFVNFQPSELLKIAFIVYMASWIASRKDDIKSFKFGFLPFLVITAFVGLVLIAEPDIGTLGVIAITGACMFFIGGGKYSQVALMFFLGLALLYVLVLIKPHAMSRIMVFLNPGFDPQGVGYQLKQSLIAVGSGGIFGRGFGMSIQKFHFLPEPIGDSIFAVFAEEFGFLGGLFLIGLLLFFLYRGLKIAMNSSNSFARLLGSGIIISIIVQSFINIGSIIGIIPMTGITLTFISQGGSSLAIALASVGILFNISRNG